MRKATEIDAIQGKIIFFYNPDVPDSPKRQMMVIIDDRNPDKIGFVDLENGRRYGNTTTWPPSILRTDPGIWVDE